MSVRLVHELALPADEAFALVADPRTHGTWVPLTRFEPGTAGDAAVVTPGDGTWSPGPGATFTVVSGPGARRGGPGFVDRMRITTWTPPAPSTGPDDANRPGLAEFRKLGPVLLGTAGFRVEAVSASSSRVVWWEDVHVTDVMPRGLTAPAADVVLRLMIRGGWRRLDRVASRGGLSPR
ncbi:hypothetical protein GCM10025864_24980 [Luteimicrobium album]|uniref:SRPBCC family protein n=1 Tax=Luteimicrobium album TaxID=1054550 RepID=A0ABQ6I4J9_9MICO|nr:SRPBCC family protein [Luteimicrobium album]GMA24739.1 hypothetical protein GCM10025864_24980 [Luteimicrobium album]